MVGWRHSMRKETTWEEKRERHRVKMLHARVQRARCLQLTSWDREKREGADLSPLTSSSTFPWITGLEAIWPALYSTFRLLHFARVFVPIPPKTAHVPSSSISSQTFNHQPSSLSPPRLCALSDKSLDYTVQQHPFISLPPNSLALTLFSLHPALEIHGDLFI